MEFLKEIKATDKNINLLISKGAEIWVNEDMIISFEEQKVMAGRSIRRMIKEAIAKNSQVILTTAIKLWEEEKSKIKEAI